jgi:hypothetical protein
MAEVWVSRAGTLKDLGVGVLVVALGPWLDSVVSWSVVALPSPKVVLPMSVTIFVALIIVAVIAAPIIAPIVGAVILPVRARSPANVFLDLLIGFNSVCPLLCHHE